MITYFPFMILSCSFPYYSAYSLVYSLCSLCTFHGPALYILLSTVTLYVLALSGASGPLRRPIDANLGSVGLAWTLSEPRKWGGSAIHIGAFQPLGAYFGACLGALD